MQSPPHQILKPGNISKRRCLGEKKREIALLPNVQCDTLKARGMGGGGGIDYNRLYEDVPPERGTFFRLEVYKRVENIIQKGSFVFPFLFLSGV